MVKIEYNHSESELNRLELAKNNNIINYLNTLLHPYCYLKCYKYSLVVVIINVVYKKTMIKIEFWKLA